MRWPSRRAQLALLGSLLLHGAFAALLLTRAPANVTPAVQPAPLAIEIVEVPPTPRPAPNPDSVAGPPKRAHRLHTPRSHESVSPPDAPPVLAAEAKPSAPAAVPPARSVPDLAAAATRSADRVAQTSLALNPPRAPPVDDRSIQAPFVVADPNARVASMIREGLGRSRVEHGLVDPYFTQLREAMASQWHGEKTVEEQGLRGFIQDLKRGFANGATENARAYAHAASEYGRTGTVAGADGPLDPSGRIADSSLGGSSEQLPSEWRSTRVALVRLTQGRDGHLLDVELVRPSIDAVMDAEILRELRRGEMVLPLPPTSGQGIHDPIRSVWAFQLVVSIAPPAPMLSGTFDLTALFDKNYRAANGGVVDLRLPLSRRILKRVELISVE